MSLVYLKHIKALLLDWLSTDIYYYDYSLLYGYSPLENLEQELKAGWEIE